MDILLYSSLLKYQLGRNAHALALIFVQAQDPGRSLLKVHFAAARSQ
jgi:hypothetical protein